MTRKKYKNNTDTQIVQNLHASRLTLVERKEIKLNLITIFQITTNYIMKYQNY